MANACYDLWKRAIGRAGIGELSVNYTAGTLKVALIDTALYTFSHSHKFHSDLSGIVGTPQALVNADFDAGATLDADDLTFSALSGDSVEALVIYIDTGTSGTSPLVAYIDTNVTGLPFTPSGGDVTISWDAAGIFDL